ncbi:iron-sulfur cluster insertion protein ErpA [Enterobacteriaceae endosymbiont of Neohaemonia nigricornis]|uniref:iron-sulfur cluster insertion protein ErpA n=1 Tax=Enterobacteriaceae endosymbiont of Neohaemonia nigricornis TaxID=2675792 RepID=UPI001FE9E6FF|nr:iron-sulfur cluster insertion protein ErpA [Enterobacteriaceae endosymbiont of Neohaemonia nigricornis]
MNYLKNNQLITFTKQAINKINFFILNNNNFKTKFRIFIVGGGCNGFQYKFMLDNKINEQDVIIKIYKQFSIITDKISIQYLFGSCIDYVENINESKFIVKNPQAKITCNCGSSFDI